MTWRAIYISPYVMDSQEFALRTGPNGAYATAQVAASVKGVLSSGLLTSYYLGAQKSQAGAYTRTLLSSS